MISRHGNFSNEGHGICECGKVAAIGKALPSLLGKWWPQKYPWQGTCISHEKTCGRATFNHKHICGSNILFGIIAHMANQF